MQAFVGHGKRKVGSYLLDRESRYRTIKIFKNCNIDLPFFNIMPSLIIANYELVYEGWTEP